jgi:hypothetical protein
MKAERAKNIFFDVAWLILLGVALLIVTIPYVFAFLAFGGGWAYYSSGDCRFEIGRVGYAMLVPPVFVLADVVWLVRHNFRSAG